MVAEAGLKGLYSLPYSQPVVLIFLLFLLIVSLRLLHWPLWTFLQQLLHNRSAWRLMFGANLTVRPSFTEIGLFFLFPPGGILSASQFILLSRTAGFLFTWASFSPPVSSAPLAGKVSAASSDSQLPPEQLFYSCWCCWGPASLEPAPAPPEAPFLFSLLLLCLQVPFCRPAVLCLSLLSLPLLLLLCIFIFLILSLLSLQSRLSARALASFLIMHNPKVVLHLTVHVLVAAPPFLLSGWWCWTEGILNDTFWT